VREDRVTGAEAWPEDAVQADDVVTETEAGPLEESDFDADAGGTDDAGGDGATTEGVDQTEDDPDREPDGEPDGGSAEEKGK
jgi:hypothetical protein